MTNLQKQYRDLKDKHPEALILFRCGDFYEAMYEDAKVCAEVLGITLTVQTGNRISEKRQLAGFPYHALDTYLPKLIRAGHRVAICDALEEVVEEEVKPAQPSKDEIIAQLQARIKELEEELLEAKNVAKIELEGAEIRCTKESNKAQIWMKRALDAEGLLEGIAKLTAQRRM